jgi:hypothetical protein
MSFIEAMQKKEGLKEEHPRQMCVSRGSSSLF